MTNADLDEEKVDGIIFRLDQLSVHLVRLCSTDLMSNEIEQLITNTVILLRSYNDNFNNQVSFQAERSLNGDRGQPSYNISSEQLQYLLDYDLSVPDIALALGVSRSTIFRRMHSFSLSVRQRMTDISEENLYRVIREIQQDFPNAGYCRVHSQLLIRGVRVKQTSVRNAMHRIDPEGVALRWLQLIPRRSYVTGPLSLWHIDGNHKLIR